MNEPIQNALTPAGRDRRERILQDVLTAAGWRRVRRRRGRLTAAAAALLLAVGLPFLLQRDPAPQVAHVDPPPAPPTPPPVSPPEPLAPRSPPRLTVEPLSDAMLLAQLDAAGLPYLELADGEVRLIATGVDPWDLTSVAAQ